MVFSRSVRKCTRLDIPSFFENLVRETALVSIFDAIVVRATRTRALCVLILGLGLSGVVTGEELVFADGPRNTFANAQVTWHLQNLRQTRQGQRQRSSNGVLKRQYIFEAEATPDQLALFPKAHFRLVMDVFSPTEDMPGQSRGNWYVQGVWTVEPDAQALQAPQQGVLTGTLSGRVQAALTFDPTLTKKTWQGAVRIPMTRVRADNVGTGVRPLRGGGELVFNAGGDGSLSVNLKLWPIL